MQLNSPLARVEGSQNLVMATGIYGGETVFGGHGAGGHPTAVAVVSDILAIARTNEDTTKHAPAKEASAKQAPSRDASRPRQKSPAVTADFVTRHYLRFLVKDRPGIIASLASILAKSEINILSVLQKPNSSKSHLPLLITLEECPTSLVEQALEQINALDFMVQPCLHLPIL